MIGRIRRKLSYANVMATIAVFMALGGGWALASGKIGSGDVKDHSLKLVDFKQMEQTSREVGVSAQDNDPDIAEAAAKKVKLAEHGPFKIYGKCYKDADGDEVFANEFISTSKNNTRMLSYEGDELMGDSSTGYLNTDTLETDREVDDSPQAADGEVDAADHINNFEAFSGDSEKTYWFGWVRGIPKNEPLTDGDHGWKAGDRCLFVFGSIG